MKSRLHARFVGRWITVCMLAATSLAAQTKPAEEPARRPPVADRVSGFRVGPFLDWFLGEFD